MAGSILSQTGRPVDRSLLAAELIRALSDLPLPDWRTEYKSACVNLGRPVQLLRPGRPPLPGWALDVAEDAALLVRLEDGTLEAVNAGEVSVRGLYGYVPREESENKF